MLTNNNTTRILRGGGGVTIITWSKVETEKSKRQITRNNNNRGKSLLSFDPKLTLKRVRNKLQELIISCDKITAFTCSIRLRTAKAGRGKPWAEVALCTPPEIGVLKSPARVPPPATIPPGAGRGMSTFSASSTSFPLLWVWPKLTFTTQERSLQLQFPYDLILSQFYV